MKPRVFSVVQKSRRPYLGLAACACALLACAALGITVPTAGPAVDVPKFTVAAPTLEASATVSATETAAVTATAEATATPVSFLKGSVIQKSNCRYGPGAFYLYKIGMREGAPIEILGRDLDGGWAYVQYAGTQNLCWINSKQIQVDGDLMALQDYYPAKAPLPQTTKFAGASILSVTGSGAAVTVEWTPVVLTDIAMPGGAGEMEYVIEVWACKNGGAGFYTLGTNDTSLTFEVDESCGIAPHADLVTQTNLGVSGIAQIALP